MLHGRDCILSALQGLVSGGWLMSDYTKGLIALRRWEQQADGSWSCHYVSFEFGTRAWRCKKGCADDSLKIAEEAEVAALIQAQQIVNSFQPSAAGL